MVGTDSILFLLVYVLQLGRPETALSTTSNVRSKRSLISIEPNPISVIASPCSNRCSNSETWVRIPFQTPINWVITLVIDSFFWPCVRVLSADLLLLGLYRFVDTTILSKEIYVRKRYLLQCCFVVEVVKPSDSDLRIPRWNSRNWG